MTTGNTTGIIGMRRLDTVEAVVVKLIIFT